MHWPGPGKVKTLLVLRHSLPQKGVGADPPLSPEGLVLARQRFQTASFAQVDAVYASPALRALQTAQQLGRPVYPDIRLAERRTGDTTGQDASFWAHQYAAPDFKNPDGESLNETRVRMTACIREILANLPDGQTALIVTHATALCSWLMGFCEVTVLDAERKLRRVTFQGEAVLEGAIEPAGGVEVRVEGNKPVGIVSL